MQTTPEIVDRKSLCLHRSRADRDKGMFLQKLAFDDVQDRLSLVNRDFTNVAVVSPFPEVWAAIFPDAHVVPDTDILDLEPKSFDLVIHALCLHWANDPVGQIIQCHRALKSDGLFICVTFGGQTLSELRAALGQAESEERNGLSPRIVPMGEIRDLGALLQRAGFALPVADSVPMKVTYKTPWHLMKDLRAMGETNALSGRLRHPTGKSVFLRAASLYESEFGENGRIPATFELVFLTGWAPDESQPKPLRPGSASARLAEALGAVETPLKD